MPRTRPAGSIGRYLRYSVALTATAGVLADLHLLLCSINLISSSPILFHGDAYLPALSDSEQATAGCNATLLTHSAWHHHTPTAPPHGQHLFSPAAFTSRSTYLPTYCRDSGRRGVPVRVIPTSHIWFGYLQPSSAAARAHPVPAPSNIEQDAPTNAGRKERTLFPLDGGSGAAAGRGDAPYQTRKAKQGGMDACNARRRAFLRYFPRRCVHLAVANTTLSARFTMLLCPDIFLTILWTTRFGRVACASYRHRARLFFT